MAKQKQKQRAAAFWPVLAAAFALRLALAFATEGYPYDMSCFAAWGDKLAASGPAAFYSEGYFADYPPGYLWVLWLVGEVRAAFGIAYESRLTGFLLALVPSVCDCLCALLVWRVGRRHLAAPAARRLAAFTAFCPLMLFDTGVWKQVDAVLALPLLACFLFLESGRLWPAALCYGLALAVKPQALLLGPVLAAACLVRLAQAQGAGQRLRRLGEIVGGAALALAPALALALPFFGFAALVPRLLEKYFDTASGYLYATVNAFNWFAALGGEWKPLDAEAFATFTWGQLGLLNLIAVTALLVGLAVFSARKKRFSPLLLAAFYAAAVFTFSHCMHERYMVPAVLLTLLAAARWDDIRLFAAGVGLSLTGFVNLAAVYTLAGTDDEWLTSATSASVAILTGIAETACCLLLCVAVWDLAVRGHSVPLPAAAPDTAPPAPAPQPRWTGRERGALAALTAATAVLSFAYLGELTAPQNALDATGVSQTVEFTVEGDVSEIWVYPGISTGGSLTVTDAAGQTLFSKELDYGTCFSWSSAAFSAAAGQTLTASVQNAQVFEISLRSADGAPVAVTGGGALLDEQAAVPETISQLNSMYFDEIYHGRTGYEQLHRLTVYETTHPPLGKDFIMLGIAVFGMTGFGWRCAGTLFGVLLVPLAWCFARRLTRRPWLGALAGVLLALDFMRFAQSRIATIDIYGTFFILLGAHCMLWYAQEALQKGVGRALVPMALGGLAFGLGCASKWTGLYAGVGLAVLYFGVLYARARQKPPAFAQEFRTAAVGGVLFYVLLPLCVYVASYLPYWQRDPDFTLADWWQCQVSMYEYHANLQATHPFESRWYTWLLGLRPVWYYQNTHLADGAKASIAGLAGPVIWIAGLVCLLWLLWRQVSGRGTRAGAGVLILYAAQLAPWMLVSRCTFLYHYFPSSMFCLAAVAAALAQLRDERRAKRIGAALAGAAAVLFALYYPALSGLPVPTWYAEALEILPSFGFY